MFKHKLYRIFPKNNAKRKINYMKLFGKHLAAKKWKFGVTLDAACVNLNDCKKK